MHFHSQLDQNNQWQKTLIEVPKQTTPYYRLYTGGVNRRFKFASPEQTLFWGCMLGDYAGVWLLHNTDAWLKPIIQPITSADIETYIKLSQANHASKQQYWANYFAKSLVNSPYSMLTQGKWTIQTGILSARTDSKFSTNVIKPPKNHKFYDNVYQDNGIFVEPLNFIDWWFGGSAELIAIKDKPHADSARVKWWRKKVKENTCPPVLAWFVNCLDAYIIIDGHSRLVAYQLENKPVELLVLFSYKIEKADDKAIAELRSQVFHSLKCRLNNERKNKIKSLSMDDINQIIIGIYDNEYERYITTAKPIANLDEQWEKEVNSFHKNHNIDKKSLQAMLERRKVVKEEDNR